ncbi:MAG: hypothetical protein QXS21_07060 [Thermoproteota archaeon]|nr:hypothetical protein [Candidatus Brockarchaeota archaeon]
MNHSKFEEIKKIFEDEAEIHLTKENIEKNITEITKEGLDIERNIEKKNDIVRSISVYEKKLRELNERLYETFSEHLLLSSKNASLRFKYTEIYDENKRLVLKLSGLKSTYLKLCEILNITEANNKTEDKDEEMINKYLLVKG